MKVFYCKSEFLGKSLIVKAENREEASNKVVEVYKDFLDQLENRNPDEKIDVDLGFIEITEEVTEI